VAQIARAKGGRVVACDVDEQRLTLARDAGAESMLDVRGREPRDVREEVHRMLRDAGKTTLDLRVFECSGTTAGQEMAFGILGRAATLVVVGYAPEPVKIRLSNVMALDATVQGTWGCPPSAFPEVLRLVFEGKVRLDPFIEHAHQPSPGGDGEPPADAAYGARPEGVSELPC
jgi:6-hydroxycyclohex-1-ene-1-carbonyl-CoA dehydrogenase